MDATTTLPVLPLTWGVVLPQMVVTLAIETSEAGTAIDAALAADRRVLLVPRIEGRFARVGGVASIEDVGQTRGPARFSSAGSNVP